MRPKPGPTQAPGWSPSNPEILAGRRQPAAYRAVAAKVIHLSRPASEMENQELIVNKLLDYDVPKINKDSFPRTQLTPIFHEAVGFSRAPVAYHIKQMKQDNESMLQCLRGEIPVGQAKLGPKPVSPMIHLSDGCWKVSSY